MRLIVSNMLSFAEFRVIHNHSPQAQMRLGRRYILVLESTPTHNIYRLSYYRSGTNRPVTMHPAWFPNCASLLDNARHKIIRRIQHGYSLVGWSENFPLLDWMSQRGYPLEALPAFKKPAIQLYLPHLSAS